MDDWGSRRVTQREPGARKKEGLGAVGPMKGGARPLTSGVYPGMASVHPTMVCVRQLTVFSHRWKVYGYQVMFLVSQMMAAARWMSLMLREDEKMMPTVPRGA